MRSKAVVSALVIAFAATCAQAQQPDPLQTTPPKPAPKPLTFPQRIRQLLSRTPSTFDDARGTPDMVVSNYLDPKGGKTTIVIVNDRRRNLIGFYIYNFGNLKDAKNKDEVYRYLLDANDAISIGTFFVDSEDDIGYKYLVSNSTTLSQSAFEFVYFAMAAVSRERKPEIRKLLGLPPAKEESPPEVKKAAEGKPPGRR
ncbi:MAG TPA: hypothetical protein VKM94_23980 [Blastocatellia bacterium]|nr:hypothetical protein [Blastocatellia bacterium]